MSYDYPEETRDFMITFAQAMTQHAYSDDFVSVRMDPQDICVALVTLSSSPSQEVRFDFLGYFVKSEEIFGKNGRTEVTNVLLDFMSNRGHI